MQNDNLVELGPTNFNGKRGDCAAAAFAAAVAPLPQLCDASLMIGPPGSLGGPLFRPHSSAAFPRQATADQSEPAAGKPRGGAGASPAIYALGIFVACGSACAMWLSGLPWGLPGVVAGILLAVPALTELGGGE